MKIELVGGGEATCNLVNVKVEPVAPNPEQESSSDSSSRNTTPVEEEAKPVLEQVKTKTRGVKVRYAFDDAAAIGEDDDFLPSGNSKKKRRTTSRHAKAELPDIGGYRPSKKKRINRKDPNRCHVCRQRY